MTLYQKLIVASGLMCFFLLMACEETNMDNSTIVESKNETGYDSLLAQQYAADDYGMKKYVMAFLKKGPNRDQDSITAQSLQRGHMDNITRMANEGKLVLAGPFLDDGDIRGIYIFNVTTIEEAEALTATDPAIKAGRLKMELKPWYGSAGLMSINDLHKRLSRISI